MHHVLVSFKKLVVSRIVFFSIDALSAVCGDAFPSISSIKPEGQVYGLLPPFFMYTAVLEKEES